MWWLLPGLVGVAALAAIAGGLFLRDVSIVRGSLLEARTSLEQVRSALGEVDVDEAARALEQADRALGEARSRSSGPLWSMVGWLPVAGDSVEVVRAVVDVATAALDIAQGAVDQGAELVGGDIRIEVVDGHLDMAPLHEAREVVAALPVGRLVDARDRLAALDPRWAPGEVLDGSAESLQLAEEALTTVARASALLEALPGFLGVDEPRRYFLGVQTPAELRGTGGLMGYWSVLEIDDGRLELARGVVQEPLEGLDAEPVDEAADAPTGPAEPPPPEDPDDSDDPEAPGRSVVYIGDLGGDPWDGVATTAEFRTRYAHTAAPGFFWNVNVDPDLPTTARVALDLFTHRTGEQLDGLVLVNPLGMQTILEAIGRPIPLPGGFDDDRLPAELAPSEFARFVTVDVYGIYGAAHTAERKRLLAELGDAAFAQVVAGGWDGVVVTRAIGSAASLRDLQVFSEIEDEQAAFTQVGATGTLEVPPNGDLLAVTANNAVGGKQDVHLGHQVRAVVELDELYVVAGRALAERRTGVRVTVDNPLPSEGLDTYIIGNCLVGEETPRCFDGPSGWNRTWFSVWSPGGDALQATRAANGQVHVRSGRFRGMQVLDHHLETPPLGEAWFEVESHGVAPLEVDREGAVYRLHWWSQSKAIPDLLDLEVVAPAGWHVADAAIVGGGDAGPRMGIHAAGVPLTVEVARDRVRLQGTATADLVLEVRLEPQPTD